MPEREKPIRDIRFFERAADGSQDGELLSDYLGKVYPLVEPREAVALGVRYALRLAERGFRTRGYDHLYVALSPTLPAGEVRAAVERIEPWMQIVEVGVPLDTWPRETVEAQDRCLLRAATLALEHLSALQECDAGVLPEVEAELAERGTAVEITRLVKETAAGTLRVTYQVLPYGTPSPVFVEYHEHATGRSGKVEAMRVQDSEDVFPLIATAGISRGMVTLKPRASFRANLTTRNYKTPIQIPLSRVLGDPA